MTGSVRIEVGLTLRSNFLERSLAVWFAICSRVGFKVELVALVSAGLDVGAGQVHFRSFGEVPAAEVLGHALEEGDVNIDGLAVVLHSTHALRWLRNCYAYKVHTPLLAQVMSAWSGWSGMLIL